MLLALKEALVPTAKYSYGGTKLISWQTYDSFRSYFEYSSENISTHLFVDRAEIVIDPAFYVQNENNYFDVEYKYHGETVLKKLDFSGDTLFLDASLYTKNGENVNPDAVQYITLRYIKLDEATKTLFANFKPVFITKEEAIKEIGTVQEIAGLDKVVGYFLTFYGRVDLDQIRKLLHEEFDYDLQ